MKAWRLAGAGRAQKKLMMSIGTIKAWPHPLLVGLFVHVGIMKLTVDGSNRSVLAPASKGA